MIAVAGCLLLGGCVSVVTVKKADPKNDEATPGLRYYLPQVFLQVTPAADGTITVEKLYLPDRRHQYAVSASSYLSAHTLDVERDEKGFLKSVVFSADSSAVAQQALTSAANLRAAQIDQKSAKAKADADQAKADADKTKAALDAADAARKAAAITLDAAQKKLDLLLQIKAESSPPSDIGAQIVAARLAVTDAQVKKDAADAAYNALLDHSKSMNAGAGNAGGEDSFPKAMEPVFYRVDMDATSVKLVQAFEQHKRATWTAPKTEVVADLGVFPSSIVVRPIGKAGALAKQVHLNAEAKAVAPISFTMPATKQAFAKMPVLSLSQDMTTIDVEVPKEVAAGDYELDFYVTPVKSEDEKPVKRQLTIRVEK